MKLFVGLGNHGEKYAKNRHNIGFMVLDALASKHQVIKWSDKFSSKVAEIMLEGEKVLLIKPQTYMNRSGRAVIAAMQFYKLSAEDITVFHDDLDLSLGDVRLKQGGGHAGHNGLRDIDANIGKDYHRVRMGIGHPGHKDLVSDYVLHDFAKSEFDAVERMIEEAISSQ